MLPLEQITATLKVRHVKGDSVETLLGRLTGCAIQKEDGSEWTSEDVEAILKEQEDGFVDVNH